MTEFFLFLEELTLWSCGCQWYFSALLQTHFMCQRSWQQVSGSWLTI